MEHFQPPPPLLLLHQSLTATKPRLLTLIHYALAKDADPQVGKRLSLGRQSFRWLRGTADNGPRSFRNRLSGCHSAVKA